MPMTAGDPTDLLVFAEIYYYELNKYEHAEALYKKAITELNFNPNLVAEDTNLPNAFAAYGLVLIKLQKFEEALDQLIKAHKFLDSDYLVIFGLAICYFQLNKIKEAEKFADRIAHEEHTKLRSFLKDEEIQLIKKMLNIINEAQLEHLNELDKAEQLHKAAINYFSAGDYENTISNFERSIELYEKSLQDLLPESTETAISIKKNLSLAYLDLSTLYRETNKQPLKLIIALLIKSLILNRNLPDAKQNLLYYINLVNGFLRSKWGNYSAKNQVVKLYKAGYDLLKTPYPARTPGRNWQGAINCLKEAERLEPELILTHHLLGLAYEGSKMDELAIDEWIKVYTLDPDFDFEYRVILGYME